jgi:predicted metal-dependent phosphoesterase TrpH
MQDIPIDALVSEQFGLVAITDHDRVDTATSLQQLAARKQLPVLTAVEMSTSWNGELTDVLCYGFDPEHNELHDLAQAIARRQQENTSEVYENLRKMGYLFLHQHELVALLEKPSARQPHALVALLKKQGYGTGEPAAGKLLTDAGFFWAANDIAAVVDAVHQSGTVCLIAHPGRGDGFTRYDTHLLDKLRRQVSIDGFEVYYPAHTPEQIVMYREYAKIHCYVKRKMQKTKTVKEAEQRNEQFENIKELREKYTHPFLCVLSSSQESRFLSSICVVSMSIGPPCIF